MASIFDSITGINVGPIDAQPTYLTQAQLGGGGSPSPFAGLDNVGSGVGNVASGLFASLGNLLTSQINNTALMSSTGQTAASLTAAKLASANAWKNYVLIAVVLLGVGGAIYALKR